MKFCTKCGNELFEHSVVCTKCGCLVEQLPRGSERADSNTSKHSLLPAVFNFVSDVFIILVFFWLAFSVATASFGYSYDNYDIGYVLCYDESGTVLALLSAFPAFVFSLVSLVMTITNRCGKSAVFSAVKRIILGFFLIVISFIFIANT